MIFWNKCLKQSYHEQFKISHTLEANKSNKCERKYIIYDAKVDSTIDNCSKFVSVLY